MRPFSFHVSILTHISSSLVRSTPHYLPNSTRLYLIKDGVKRSLQLPLAEIQTQTAFGKLLNFEIASYLKK